MGYDVGHRRSSDPALLWLAAVAPIQPLPWEPPYATGGAPKRQKKISLEIAEQFSQKHPTQLNFILEVLNEKKRSFKVIQPVIHFQLR